MTQLAVPMSARWFTLPLLVLGFVGCAPSTPTEITIPNSPGTSSEVVEPALREAASSADTSGDANEEVTVRTANLEQYQALLAENQGQVILVDFWATWCPPCKAQFPHTVQLAKQFKDEGLRVFSVSFDDPEATDAVLAFLKKQDADIVNLISEYGSGVNSPEKFAIEGGAVPYYKLYDRQGKLRHQFSGDPEGIEGTEAIDTIDARVNELLAETP